MKDEQQEQKKRNTRTTTDFSHSLDEINRR